MIVPPFCRTIKAIMLLADVFIIYWTCSTTNGRQQCRVRIMPPSVRMSAKILNSLRNNNYLNVNPRHQDPYRPSKHGHHFGSIWWIDVVSHCSFVRAKMHRRMHKTAYGTKIHKRSGVINPDLCLFGDKVTIHNSTDWNENGDHVRQTAHVLN